MQSPYIHGHFDLWGYWRIVKERWSSKKKKKKDYLLISLLNIDLTFKTVKENWFLYHILPQNQSQDDFNIRMWHVISIARRWWSKISPQYWDSKKNY